MAHSRTFHPFVLGSVKWANVRNVHPIVLGNAKMGHSTIFFPIVLGDVKLALSRTFHLIVIENVKLAYSRTCYPMVLANMKLANFTMPTPRTKFWDICALGSWQCGAILERRIMIPKCVFFYSIWLVREITVKSQVRKQKIAIGTTRQARKER